MPDGKLVLILYHPNLYLYDGKKFKLISQQFPYHKNSALSNIKCMAPISNEELIFGLGTRKEGSSFTPDRHLYIINLHTGNSSKGPQTLPHIEGSKCGAFGPPENRKLFILGGDMKNPDSNDNSMIPYNGTIVYDPKSQEFTYPGEDLSNTASMEGEMTPYMDTFFFNDRRSSRDIWLFDYNRTHPQLVKEVTTVQRSYLFMTTLPTKALQCS
eukprot:TCALIF_08736-PA protein Name:"Protein of unknown function" AED:0.08 eAED:0.08 QI:0/1/0.5/1/1/0.5/2/82/212